MLHSEIPMGRIRRRLASNDCNGTEPRHLPRRRETSEKRRDHWLPHYPFKGKRDEFELAKNRRAFYWLLLNDNVHKRTEHSVQSHAKQNRKWLDTKRVESRMRLIGYVINPSSFSITCFLCQRWQVHKFRLSRTRHALRLNTQMETHTSCLTHHSIWNQREMKKTLCNEVAEKS